MTPIPIGRRRHVVTVLLRAVPVAGRPDGDFDDLWQPSGPPWQVAIEPMALAADERHQAGTTIGSATHLVTGPYRADVTVQARLQHEQTRLLNIVGVSDPEDRHSELIVRCQEVIA